jgi:hypothetical protein
MARRFWPVTSIAYATFSAAVLLGRSLKSWKTQPISLRCLGKYRRGIAESLTPLTLMVPRVGSSSLRIRRIIVDLPEPLAPTRKTNSPASTLRFTFSRATASLP